jgi:hypothetical protein
MRIPQLRRGINQSDGRTRTIAKSILSVMLLT